MTETMWRKAIGRIAPADQAAEDFLAAIKIGAEFMAKTWRPRNPKHHRLFWAMVAIVLENTDHRFQDKEHVADLLKYAVGHVRVYAATNSVDHCPQCGGEIEQSRTIIKPLSTNWGAMDQDKFNPFFDAAMAYICNRILVGTDLEALRQEVERAAYGRYPA